MSTERERGEAALARLRHSEDKFSRFFHLLPEAMAIIQRSDSVILDVNPAWETSTGFARRDAIGSEAESFLAVPERRVTTRRI